jgi:cytochrome P450
VSGQETFPFPLSLDDFGCTADRYARRRQKCPLGTVTLPSGDQACLLVRYDDVAQALRSRSLSRDLRAPRAPRLLADLDMSANPNLIINLDPPEHTRLRRLVQAAFTPARVAAWRPVIQGIASQLLADMAARGPAVDLVSSLARPLALHVMCELLGVPAADREAFTSWTESFFSTAPAQQRMESGGRFLSYVRDLVLTCRASPGDGLIDALIAARDDDDRLTEAELRHMISTLIIAGHENTAGALARGVFALLRDPAQYAALRGDPSLLPAAVEEILRFEMPSEGALLRVATRDLDLPSGGIAAGDAVLACIPSANRDPGHFADPERFDIARTANPHLAFGAGAHFCVGAALARLELGVALEALTGRFPGLRLACDAGNVPFSEATLIRAPRCLPVTW